MQDPPLPPRGCLNLTLFQDPSPVGPSAHSGTPFYPPHKDPILTQLQDPSPYLLVGSLPHCRIPLYSLVGSLPPCGGPILTPLWDFPPLSPHRGPILTPLQDPPLHPCGVFTPLWDPPLPSCGVLAPCGGPIVTPLQGPTLLLLWGPHPALGPPVGVPFSPRCRVSPYLPPRGPIFTLLWDYPLSLCGVFTPLRDPPFWGPILTPQSF